MALLLWNTTKCDHKDKALASVEVAVEVGSHPDPKR